MKDQLKFKKSVAIFISLATVAVGIYFIMAALATPQLPTSVACSEIDTTFGVAEKTIEAPQSSTYTVWSRIMATDNLSNSYYLSFGDDNCTLIESSESTANEWAWVDYIGGDPSDTLQVELGAGEHNIRMIGAEPGVRLDNILLTSDPDCMPQDTGVNCLEEPAPEPEPEPEPLTAPSNLEAINKTHGSVELTWEGDSPYYFLVYRDDTLIAAIDNENQNSYNDSSLNPETTYSYHVTAVDENDNESDSSNIVTITTPEKEDTEAPTPPGNLQAEATTHDTVSLSWSASTDNVGVDGYLIYRDGAVVNNADADQTSWDDETVLAETTYTYYARAYDAAGNISDPSEDATITTPEAPPVEDDSPDDDDDIGESAVDPPTDLTAKVVSKRQVNLSWGSSSDAVNYHVYRDDQRIATVDTTSFGDGSVRPNRTYRYHVVAVDSTGRLSNPSEDAHADTSTIDSDDQNDDENDDDDTSESTGPGQGWGRGGRR